MSITQMTSEQATEIPVAARNDLRLPAAAGLLDADAARARGEA
jgi:hypothetical protein